MGKAQSSLEYLLLIGGAILVAVILIGIIISLTSSAEPETLLATAHALCAKFPEQECITNTVTVRGNTFICDNTLQNTCRAVRDAIPISLCGAGMQADKTYYLTQDIDDPTTVICFFLGGQNITLNCKNNTIRLTQPLSVGVLLFGQKTTVKNCKIIADKFGIQAISSDNFIINNSITSSNIPLLITSGSSNNSINKNNLCGAIGIIEQISIQEGTSSQNATFSGLNSCVTCKDAKFPTGGSPVCAENGAIDKCPIGCS